MILYYIILYYIILYYIILYYLSKSFYLYDSICIFYILASDSQGLSSQGLAADQARKNAAGLARALAKQHITYNMMIIMI